MVWYDMTEYYGTSEGWSQIMKKAQLELTYLMSAIMTHV